LATPIKKTRSHGTIAKRVGLAKKAEIGQGLTVLCSRVGRQRPACNSLDHLVGAADKRQRNREAERLRGPEIDDHLDFRRLLDRHVGWLVAPENAPGVDAPEAIQVRNAASVADQSAGLDERAKLVAPACWPPLAALSLGQRARDRERSERGYCAPIGEQLVQQLQSLPIRFRTQRGHACEVTARSVQAGYETDLNRISAGHKNNGDRGGFSLARYRRLAVRDNHAHLTTNQIGCQCRQSITVPFRPAVFDRHIPTLDIAGFRQALPKRGQEVCILLGRSSVKKADHRHRRLLRHCRGRPRRRATEQRDELAAGGQSITSSAVNRSVGGIVRPSVLAVARLITSSYLVGCWKGRSPAFSPRRTRSTYDAAPRYCSTRSVP